MTAAPVPLDRPGTVVAFAIIGPVQKRFDKKHIYLASVVLNIADLIVLVVLRLIDVMPENGHPVVLPLLVAGWALFIASSSVTVIIAISMIGDVLDANEARTGLRQEGMCSAAITFSSKASAGIGVVLGGLILDHAIAFPSGADPMTVAPEPVFKLGLIAGVALPLLYFLPFALMTRYRLSRTEHAEIQRLLAERRSEHL